MAATMLRLCRVATARSTVRPLSKKQLRLNTIRPFYLNAALSGQNDAEFELAQQRVTKLSSKPDNQVMLQLYGLFKQSTVGKCTADKPGAFDFVGKAKWTAWNGLGDISQDEAQKQYIDLVNELVAADGGGKASAATSGDASGGAASTFNTLTASVEGGVYAITLNRPDKKNALTHESYRDVIGALKEAAEDEGVVLATITGAGDYYCSGNDLSNFANINPDDIAKHAKEGKELLLEFVKSFIDFPKPLIGVVNGPAIGVAVTTLGLCDVIYATDKATFHTPMVSLGQSAEGASTVMFPRLMGMSRACEMLFFGKKISAKQACDWGLVTEVFPDHSFRKDVSAHIAEISKLPPQSLQYSKQLMRAPDKAALHAANVAECERLEERWQSTECFTAIMNFFQKKSNL